VQYNQLYEPGKVKITMIDLLLNLVAPHLCSGCGKVGTLLCDECKYDIISEPYERCLVCQAPSVGGICKKHRVAYSKAWCVGERRDCLQRLIGGYKFKNTRAAYLPLADLLDKRLPELPKNTVIVPVPTVESHVRERGYDHVGLIARHLGRKRELPVVSLVGRSTKTVQRHADRNQRIVQALKAFVIDQPVDPDKIYLVVDDIVTTGATTQPISSLLKNAGAATIWVATVARQPLD
jgi:ComF family protein